MSFHINCPQFSVGACVSYKEGKCKYKYHKCCKDNFLCDEENCKYGHGISVMKRLIVNKIYDEKYDIKTSVYETSENRCGMPMNCINPDCNSDHHLEAKDRAFIYKMANIIVPDEDAWNEYEKLYYSNDSPGSDAMSAGSTMSPGPIMSPPPSSIFTKTFASLLKDDYVPVKEDPDDEMTSIMDDMLKIRKDISIKNKQIIDIKENLEKLKQALIVAEDDLKIGKNKLKETATKIANF
jgi:hypothetical protein